MNKINSDLARNNKMLSLEFENILENIEPTVPPIINTDTPGIPNLFRNYEFPVSAWPIIINAETNLRLDRLSVRLPILLRKIPSLYFKNNISDIANFYFNGNSTFTEFAILALEKNVQVGCRLDLTLTSTGFKILEANIGSSIGGFQVSSFEPLIKNCHNNNDIFARNNLTTKNIQESYIRFVIEQVENNVNFVEDEINLLLLLDNKLSDAKKNDVQSFVNSLLNKELARTEKRGQSYICDPSQLDSNSNGLFIEGSRIHGILVFGTAELPLEIFRAFMIDTVYLPDNISTMILNDKKNLSLLRCIAEKDGFSAEDNKLVLDCIPWTEISNSEFVKYNEQDYKLIDLLREKKDMFVIKAAVGMQGKDVFVGRFTTANEWEEAINFALKGSDFVIQEYSDSLNFLAPNVSNQWVPHKFIWGAFGFGENYGGVWVRMSDIETDDDGIINSARGAVEALVYEAEL